MDADDRSNRLRNIEETEKAKREMMERKAAGVVARKGKQEEDFSAARCTYTLVLKSAKQTG